MSAPPIALNRWGKIVLGAYAVVLIVAVWPRHAHAETLDLQAFNRAENRAYPLNNRPLAWADEGQDGYDCKGFVTLKARDLHRLGVPYSHMASLSVTPNHRVLLVGGRILDNLSPWLGRPSDYKLLPTPNNLMWDMTSMGIAP